jgi:hypothetical protein
MKKIILSLVLVWIGATFGVRCAMADDLESLAGKWVADRDNAQGQDFKQVLTIKQNKFTFEIQREGGRVALHAEGDVKTERLGPFKVAKFFNIQGGNSASDLQPVDDDRTVFYTLNGDEIIVAQNFDKERDQPPSVTKFTKQAAAPETKTLVIDKIVMHKSPQTAEYYVCLDATVGETTKRFHIENKTWEKDGVTITTDLAIPNVKKDQTCKFVLKLDDVAGDECTEEMDNKSTGSFSVTESGSQEFKPEDGWRYTLHWHLK